jgi:hypothetical protein
MKNIVFWYMMLCGFSKNQRFGGTYRFYHQSDIEFLYTHSSLLVTANVVHRFLVLVALMIRKIGSFEPSVLTRATGRNILEGGILHSSVETLKLTRLP